LIATAIDAPTPSDAVARAWRDASHAVACDVDERWEHGRVLRATRYPTYYDLNFVLVEDAAPLEGEEVRAVADRALAEHAHRRVVFDHLENAEPLRAGFEAGATDYVTKPFSIPQLTARVRACLARTQLP